jgi:hypothetical protein
MSGEHDWVRERVRQAIAGPVEESEKLLANLPDADAKTTLSILVSGWFRGLADGLEELAIAVDGLLARLPVESTPAAEPVAERDEPSPKPREEEPKQRVDLTDADDERLIETARKSREETAKLGKEAERARKRLEQ